MSTLLLISAPNLMAADPILPATTDLPPALITPSSDAPPSQGVAATPTPVQPALVMPKDVLLKPDQAVLSYLMRNDYFNPFPDNLFHPNDPITRAEFVVLLYRASNLVTPFVSEFPYFRDVPTDYWAYLPIEGFRMRNILAGFEGGFFQPERSITRLEAAVMLSQTLEEGWLRMTEQEVEATFSVYNQSAENIPEWGQYHLARSIYAGFLLPIHRYDPMQIQESLLLELDSPLTRMDAARMIYRRALIEEEEQAPMIAQQVWLPAGITMPASPTTAISQEVIAVGHTVYFALTDNVEVSDLHLLLPRGTRVYGKITDISADRHQATVSLDRASLPSGEFYGVAATVSLTFQADKKEVSFIVPGQVFQIQTLPPP